MALTDLPQLFEAIDSLQDATVLEALVAYAQLRLQNIQLQEDNSWLESRIDEEGKRLAYA